MKWFLVILISLISIAEVQAAGMSLRGGLGFSCDTKAGTCSCSGEIDGPDCKAMKANCDASIDGVIIRCPTGAGSCTCHLKPTPARGSGVIKNFNNTLQNGGGAGILLSP